MESNMITSIKSNVKRGVDLQLRQPCVLITGENGAGKTSIINAVTLALFGEVRDAGFRDAIKDGKMIAMMSSDGDVFSEVTTSLGNAAYKQGKGKAKAERDNFEAHDLFPAAEEVAKGSSETIVKFLLSNVGHKPMDILPRIASRLTPTGRSYFEFCLAASNDDIVKAYDLMASLAKQAGDIRKTAEKALEPYESVSVGVDHTKAVRLSALRTILENQTTAGCQVCGSSHEQEHYTSRLERVKAAQGKLPGVSALTDDRKQIWLEQLEQAKLEEDARKACLKVMMEEMVSTVDANRDTINAQLNVLQITHQRNWRIGVAVVGGKAVLGLLNGTNVSPSASGAEWVYCIAQLAAYMGTKVEGLKLLLLPDRSYDETTLTSLFMTLPQTGLNCFLGIARADKWGVSGIKGWQEVHLQK